MPIRSAKQFRLMEAAAHGKIHGKGPSRKVAKEFLAATPKSKKSKFARAKRKKK